MTLSATAARRWTTPALERPHAAIGHRYCDATSNAADWSYVANCGDTHAGRRDHEAAAGGAQGSLRHRRSSSARPCAGADACLGDPQGAPWAAGNLHATRSVADVADRRRRGVGLRDGRRRQLQRRLGRPRHPNLAARRAQKSVPHRRLRCRRNRLGLRFEGPPLESGRRSRHPLQSRRRRRRRMQRRRPAALCLAAHLGLRDAGRIIRAVLPRAVASAHAETGAPHLGGSGLLYPHARHRLPDALWPSAAHPEARRSRAGVGRLRRPRRFRRAARGCFRCQRHRHHLG